MLAFVGVPVAKLAVVGAAAMKNEQVSGLDEKSLEGSRLT